MNPTRSLLIILKRELISSNWCFRELLYHHTLYVTCAGKESKFWATGVKKWEVFSKISPLSPRLVIPVLQIIVKHLKVCLFVRFLRGVCVLCSLLTLSRIRSAKDFWQHVIPKNSVNLTRKEKIARCSCIFNYSFICNEHTDVIFTFGYLFFLMLLFVKWVNNTVYSILIFVLFGICSYL